MDPLSVTASIIAILHLSGKVLMHLNDVKDASKDRVQCAIEVSNLHSLLLSLRFRLEEGVLNQRWYTAVQGLAVKNGPLDQFKESLEMLQAKMTDSGRLNKFGQALIWKFKKEEIASILSRMERLKSLIDVALMKDQFELSKVIKDDTNYLRTHVLGIESRMDTVRLQQDSARDRMLLDWISPTDYRTKQSAIIKKRQDGTGEWFLNASKMKRWQREPKATLFCPGIPGAGKTLAAAITIDHLQSYKAQHEQDVHSMLAAILKQLVQGRLSTAEHIDRLYQQHANKGTKPSLDDICGTLRDVLGHYLVAYIIVDALDECQDSTRCQLLAKLRDLQTARDVRLMATSRPMPEIEGSFEGALRLEVHATQEDVERFVAGQIYSLPLCIRRDATLQEVVRKKITEAVDGMFLLAYLRIESLRDKKTVKAVKLALTNLLTGAEGLSKAYKDAIQRISNQMPGECQLAKKVLSWITLAKRPLTVTEICCALAVEPNEQAIDPDNIPDSEDLQSVCAGLVVVDQESAIIRLVHYTTQKYLEQIIDTWHPEGRLHIATTCVTYLALDEFQHVAYFDARELERTLTKHPFLSYAGNYWGYHTKTVEAEVIQLTGAVRLDVALSCALSILRFPSYMSKKLDEYNDADTIEQLSSYMSTASKSDERNKADTILHYLAQCGLLGIMKITLSDPDKLGRQNIDEEDSVGRTPLSYAVEQGHCEVVKLLLDKSADVNKHEYSSGNALQLASGKGHVQMVELLLDAGADVNAQAGYYDNALNVASYRGHEQVIKLLLNRGAQINAQNTMYTVLGAASANGYEQVAKLLLDSGAEINAQNKYGGTALHDASRGGYEQVVELLLDRGAEVNLQPNNSVNSLWEAAWQNHEQVAKLLIEANANISSCCEYRGSVLHRFASWGNVNMVGLLLTKGADIDLHSIYFSSPLYMASEENHEQTVRLLLEAGADPNIQCGEHGNALFAASLNGYDAVVKLLLEYDAHPDAKGVKYNNTPLYAASSKGHEKVVKWLVGKGANVNAQGGYYGNALFAASVSGYETVVKLLLEEGANPDAQGTKYNNTPLYAASSRGFREVVKMLVENDADVNARGGYWGSALVAASKGRHEQVVKLLLDSGAESCEEVPHARS